MKSQIRRPKAESNEREALGSDVGLLSDFVIRISSLSRASYVGCHGASDLPLWKPRHTEAGLEHS